MMRTFIRLVFLAIALPLGVAAPAAAAPPETVYFQSGDGRTELVGYLFKPQTAGPAPAVVMLHGRGGPYSSNSNASCGLVSRDTIGSPCNAATLSKRHMMWGSYWSDRGYLALLPDSFGPRGKGHGFGRFTHDDPERADVNEKTVRPLDAEGALTYLRQRRDVIAGRIILQGWSNGGSTTLNVMYRQSQTNGSQTAGFRAALAFYPGCGEQALLRPTLKVAAPITMFLAADDEEVSPTICQHVAARSREAGTPIGVVTYRGASHDFDEPSASRQAIPGNHAAMEDAKAQAGAIADAIHD
jgi:carboxymethylenebutenolidase